MEKIGVSPFHPFSSLANVRSSRYYVGMQCSNAGTEAGGVGGPFSVSRCLDRDSG